MCNYQPWRTAQIYRHSALILKEEEPWPDYVNVIIDYVSQYENIIRELWEKFKQNPVVDKALELAKMIKEIAGELWMSMFLEVLNIDWMPYRHQKFYEDETNKHYGFIDGSLLPDIVTGIEKGITDFSNMDYRTIILYSGALWSFGFLGTVMFDGLDIRDLADLFLFYGPKDENNCTGPRGCSQHVGQIYTVAEILVRDIVPGHLKCLTNCRHMLLPVASPL